MMPLHIVMNCKDIDAVSHVSIRAALSWALWLAGNLPVSFSCIETAQRLLSHHQTTEKGKYSTQLFYQ